LIVAVPSPGGIDWLESHGIGLANNGFNMRVKGAMVNSICLSVYEVSTFSSSQGK